MMFWWWMMTQERILKIKDIFEKHYSIVKTCILRQNKICSRDIRELIVLGYVVKVKTGYYAWKLNAEKLNSMELVQSIIPNGIISLESAARIHKLVNIDAATESVCVTIPTNMIKPILPTSSRISLFYCSEEKFHIGLINYKMEHRNINIYNIERTVCDLFKYSDRIENEIAVGSLKVYIKRKDKNVQKLLEYASLLRVQKYINPLVEVLL